LQLATIQGAWGQATMPANWQQLPPDQFVAAAETLFAGDPTSPLQREVVQHAWLTFLTNEVFVNSADWDTVEKMMELFIARRGLLVSGNTFGEREVAQQQVEADLATLRTRIATRVDNNGQIVTQSSFAELRLLDQTLAASGISKAERAKHFAAWMGANNWRTALSLAEHGTLLGALDADRIDRSNMSVRWTGFLTAPRTDAYTFSQLAHYKQDGVMKVWINEQQILDSTPLPVASPAQARERFKGKPVTLTAGQPAPVRIEFSHNVVPSAMIDNEAYPMAALLWEAGNLQQQVVPGSAFSPPDGVQGTTGLLGEYFGDAAFTQNRRVTSQVDPAVDLIWPGYDDFWRWRQVVPVHKAEWEAVFDASIATLTDSAYLATLTPEELHQMLLTGGRHVLGSARASQRIEFLDALLSQPEKLAGLDPFLIGRIVKHTYMLPGDRHVRLIGTWAERREQPRTELGTRIGWEEGSYETHNLQFYWHIAHFLTHEHFGDIEQLWDEYLVRANGECNLAVAYVTAWAAQESQNSHQFRERIAARLADERLTGNQRATWLFAKAYGEGVMLDGRARPLRGLEYLEEASLVAETPEYQFWALQEMVARHGSHGSADAAKALLDRFAGQFNAPQQQTAIAAWRQKIDELAAVYAQHATDDEAAQRQEQLTAYVAILRERLQSAQQRGDAADAQHHRTLLERAQGQSISN
jgi:hypothetical protein